MKSEDRANTYIVLIVGLVLMYIVAHAHGCIERRMELELQKAQQECPSK